MMCALIFIFIFITHLSQTVSRMDTAEAVLTLQDVNIFCLPQKYVWMKVCSLSPLHSFAIGAAIAFKCKSIISLDCALIVRICYQVKAGTKISNVLAHARKVIASGETRALLWSGYGNGVVKTISCAETMKREQTLNQLIKVCRLR